MSLFIFSINSGSNGNCYYVGNRQEAVLVDAGISCREIEKRLQQAGLCMQKVKAVFISHEHSDHIRGLAQLSKKYRLPVYISAATLRQSRLRLEKELLRDFRSHQAVMIGSLAVTAFPKQHDAGDPYSFMIGHGATRVGVFTDIGTPCSQLVKYFSQCHAAFLESNYDEDMLAHGPYPYFLKQRITNGYGHLSNRQALDLFINHRPPYMTHLLLSHLSNNNNCPKLVHDLFARHANGVHTEVASRHEASPVYEINGEKGIETLRVSLPTQLALGFTH